MDLSGNRSSLVFFLFFLVCSICILYPTDLGHLFHYDDNPVRYMIARMWVEGRLNHHEMMVLPAYGSAEIYIPFFFIAKVLGLNYELTYNVTSLAIFFLVLAYVFSSIPRNDIGIFFIFPLHVLFGIVSLVKGSLHWFFASAVLLNVLCSPCIKVYHLILLGISYFISPPATVASSILAVALWFGGDRARAVKLILPFAFLSVKFILTHQMVIADVRRSFELSMVLERDLNIFSLRSFAPPDISAFLRPIFVDYFKEPLLYVLAIYIVFIRAILTREKTAILVFVSFYVIAMISTMLIRAWTQGHDIPAILLAISSFIYGSNPFRYAPLFASYLLIRSDTKRYDRILGAIVVVSLLLPSAYSLMKREGELPRSFPKDVDALLNFLGHSESSRILVEGDVHLIERGELIHPLYGSHIIPYIVAELKHKSFYGGILPWTFGDYNFFAGRFGSKPLESSDVLNFVEEKGIDTVMCWTEKCIRFFRQHAENELNFGKITVLELRMQRSATESHP